MKNLKFYKTCRWECPACGTPQNGIIKKLKTLCYLKCCLKGCEHVVTSQIGIATLTNLTIGDIKPKHS
jgi:hypothetical protein